MTLKTRCELETMMYAELASTNGASADIERYFDTLDVNPTEEQKQAAIRHAWTLFPEGGFGWGGAWRDYLAAVKRGEV